MRLGPILFLLLGLAVFGVGVRYLYIRFVREAESRRSAEDEQLLAELRTSRAEREGQVKVAEAMVEGARKARDTVPADDPKGNRAKLEEVLAKAEDQHRKATQLYADTEKVLELNDKIDAIQEETRTTALRRGILFTLLGAFWSIRAAASLRAKPAPS